MTPNKRRQEHHHKKGILLSQIIQSCEDEGRQSSKAVQIFSAAYYKHRRTHGSLKQ